MLFKLSRKDFISGFLSPIGKLNKQCQLSISKDRIISTIVNGSSTVYANIEYKLENEVDESMPMTLNITDCEKLQKILQALNDDVIELNYEPGTNKLKGGSTLGGRFTMVLLDPSLMAGKKFDFSRLYQKKYETEFIIEASKFKEMIKAASTMDSEKMYVSCKNGMVFAEFTDKAKKNVDEYEILVSANFTGNPVNNLCFDIQTLKEISASMKADMKIKISSLGIIMYEHTSDNTTIRLATTVLKQ